MGNGEIKKIVFLAVTVAVIANLLLGNSVLAKKLEIRQVDIERVKLVLDITKLLGNIAASDDKLKTILNMTIGTGKIGADITYGLVVLTSLNEMDFIDSVISQRYKREATAYFEGILNERTNLRNYYKGIGYDLPRVVAGRITNPIAALTLNTFDITDKTITILSMIKVLEKEMKYDGLWVYFDQRKGNNSHEEAWEIAEIKLGGLVIKNQRRFGGEARGETKNQLEQQFASLYEKWAPYVEINKGIKKEFKKQVNDELRNTISLAVDDYDKLAKEKEEARISFWEPVKNALAELAEKVAKAGNGLKEEFTKINNKVKQLAGFGGAQISQAPQKALEAQGIQETAENNPGVEMSEVPPPSFETMASEESIIEEIKELEKRVEDSTIEVSPQSTEESQIMSEIDVGEISPPSLEATTTEGSVEVRLQQELNFDSGEEVWCQKQTGTQPLRNSVIFSEIAWMGTQNSANDEWIKIKNVSGSEIDLAGWQVLDKDQQIKIIFPNKGENVQGYTSNILRGGSFLLERTNDESLAGEAANFIYTGALNDSDEELYIFDNYCRLQDEVLAVSAWPSGDKNNHWPMERNADLSWRNQGGQAVIFNYGTPAVPPPEISVQSQTATTTILISEVQISPIGERFVELYNPNNEAVDLAGWYIQRKTQTGNSYNSFITSTDFEGKSVGAFGYFLIASSSAADIIQNLTLTEGNFLRLKNTNQEIIDEITWENPSSSQSWGRQWSTTTQSYGDFEIQTPTPKAQNQSLSQSSNQAPSAFFVWSPLDSIETGQEITFDAASSSDADGQISFFNWDFGDSSLATSSQATTSHSFSSAGDFSVSLVVTDNGDATSSATTTVITIANAEETPSFLAVINEIAWAGTKAGSSDEWIELYNNSSSNIDLAGWTLKAFDGTPSTAFSGVNGTTTIGAGSYFLLERTASNTTNVAEDYIFTGALSNEGEKLELRDASNNLIDLVDFSSSWPAGSSTPSYISMERISATTSGTSTGNWLSNNLITRNGLDASGNKINGTPRAQNSVSYSSTTISSLADLFSEFSEINLASFGGPYIISNNLTVPANNTLRISSGATLKFNSLKKLDIQGRLEAVGAVFTANSDSPNKGFWQGISFSNTLESKIENTTLKYGKAAIEVNSGIQRIKNNTFEENEAPVSLVANNASTTFSGNSARDNNVNGILTNSSTITVDTVWQSESVFPFVIDYAKSVDAGKILTIKEGTVVKIKPQTGSGWTGNFDINGKLVVEGTEINPVVITSFKDDEYGGDTNNDGTSTLPTAGDWKYVRLKSLTATSTLDKAIIRYGSGNCSSGFCWGAIRQDQGVGIEIKNSTIEKNIWGIFSEESSSDCEAVFRRIRIENTVFSQNERNIHLGGGNECTP